MSTSFAEKRTLALHPLAIHTFIKAQAGSLAKALSEAVMNSLDASANVVKINLTTNGFVIKDDGQGFKEKEEVSAWFETLGFPHDVGNHRIYGQFGMGRAQMWAFARTKWLSNKFTMDVDIQKKGLDYDFNEVAVGINGTEIHAQFYEPMTTSDLARVILELSSLVKYTPGTVIVNGSVANTDPSLEKWDVETDDAWMRFDSKSYTLDVYNAGVLVSHFPRYKFGATGIVVTKPDTTLSLNIARNEILVAECKTWQKIVKQFPQKKAAASLPKALKPTETQLRELASEVGSGNLSIEDALFKHPELIKSVTGKALPFTYPIGGWAPSKVTTVVIAPKGDPFGKKLQKLKLAETITTCSLERFGNLSIEGLKELYIKSYIESSLASLDPAILEKRVAVIKASVWTDNPEKHFSEVLEGKHALALSELTAQEKMLLFALKGNGNELKKALAKVMPEKEGAPQLVLKISLGDSPTKKSWYNPVEGEWALISSEATKSVDEGAAKFTQFLSVSLKELCRGIAGNDAEGDVLFSKLITKTDILGSMLVSTMGVYVKKCSQEGIPLQKFKVGELDRLNVE